MPIVKTLDILADCSRRKYAVGAFNINGLDQPAYLIKKAEQLKSPLLVVEPGVIEKYVDFLDFAFVTARAAKNASVPVGIHLSHGLDLAQFERACKAGFTSVMYDGSKLPYEENVKNTRTAVEIGHKLGCAVEGELGALGSSFVDVKESMTDPETAKDFVKRTGVDILAVSIGNAHGFYKGTPSLDFDRLDEIKAILEPSGCYLTLHGGTGIPESHIKRSIEKGITKICIYTEMCHEGKQGVKAYLEANPEYKGNYDIPDMLCAMMDGFKNSMESSMNMFMSIGKAGKAVQEDRSDDVFASLSKETAGNSVPRNMDVGPEYPSKPALNPSFKSNGKYWD